MSEVVEIILSVVVSFLAIIASMTLHELMHGFVAYKLGDETAKSEGRLTLNPIKYLDLIYSVILPLVLVVLGMPVFGGAKPVPVDSRNLKGGEWGMAAVALAGPFMNIILAYISFLMLWFLGDNEVVRFISIYFMNVNLGFACFNMIPIPPLDGSRLLYAIAPDGVRNLFNNIERGMGVTLIYVLLLLFGGFFASVIGAMRSGVFDMFVWTIGG